MRFVIVFVVAAVAMEPLAALLHRGVMHAFGWGWHRSHHQRRGGTWERNDLFPVVFAGATIAVMAAGAAFGRKELIAAGAGVTAYGLLYLIVHDLCIHGRFVGRPVGRRRYVRYVRSAHRVHHLYNAAPYGFLSPIVPGELRRRATAATEPFDGRRQRASATDATLDDVGTESRREKTS
ncbi:MAG: fatty acid hydroxylase [Acidimicrobiia bacterium]|nr:fatty acid hydroxylase [Acidimicrobiia bacterium]